MENGKGGDMKGSIQFEPVSNERAAKIIASKPAVQRKVFDAMLPEI